MSTQRSLISLIERAKSTLTAKTGQDNPAIDAIACAIAGVSYGQYGYQDQLFRELSPETASEPWLYLHAKRYGIERLLPTFAAGFVRFEQLGGVVVIPKGTLISRDDQHVYITTVEQRSNEDVDVVAITAGSSSNYGAGGKLKLLKAISGINPDNVLSMGIGGGADIEDIEHWRQRICTAFNRGILIGRRSDYEAWALSAHADVDYAWALDNTPELGMVKVFIGARVDDPSLSRAIVDEVQDYIESVRLAGCHPIVDTPKKVAIPVTIQNVDDAVVRKNVTLAIQSLFRQKMGKREPLSPTEIVIAVAPITSNYIVVEPRLEQVLANDEIHVLGDITWTRLS